MGLRGTYPTKYADYIPLTHKHIGDVPEQSDCAKEPVQLIFLMKTGADIKARHISKTFQVPSKSHYNAKKQT